jgi:galactose-1-phosphate uridylyltransferase
MDLAVDPGLAHPARDQLRILRAEIEDEDFLVLQY